MPLNINCKYCGTYAFASLYQSNSPTAVSYRSLHIILLRENISANKNMIQDATSKFLRADQ